ncbi:MAG: mitochondrial fission ELM1 family protein [Pseudomonadota bacterium]
MKDNAASGDALHGSAAGTPDAARLPTVGRSAWLISDGKAGVETQCQAVSDALGLAGEFKRVAPRAPWRWIAPWGPPDPREVPGNASSGQDFSPPWPEFIIAGGRMTVPVVRAVRRLAGPQTFAVFLQDPRVDPDIVDCVWVPAHDRLRGARVFTTLTTPHRMTLARLDDARLRPPQLMDASVPSRLAILVGGNSRTHRWRAGDIDAFLAGLTQVAQRFVGVYATVSRRTPDALKAALTRFFDARAAAGAPGFLWSGEGPNPFSEMLAHAHHLIVTADSANMVCEACVTGRPVHVFHPSGGSRKFDRLHAALTAHGATRRLTADAVDDGAGTGDRADDWTYTPLSATETIAAEIARRWSIHRESLRAR